MSRASFCCVAAACFLLLAVLPVEPVHGATLVRAECPIPGDHYFRWSYYRNDGFSPRPPFGEDYHIHQCVNTKLLVYRGFTKVEVEKLKSIVASKDYKSLLESRHSPSFIAYWLDERSGAKLDPDLIARAISESRPGDLRSTYQKQYLALFDRGLARRNVHVRVEAYLIAADSARELGMFEQARRLLIRADVRSVPVMSETPADAEEKRWGLGFPSQASVKNKSREWLHSRKTQIANAIKGGSTSPLSWW